MTDILKQAYNNFLKFETALAPGDPFLVDLNADDVRGSDETCIDVLGSKIMMSNDPAHLYFTGFRGSGKSTELKRLQANLEAANYEVVYIDSVDYLNLDVTTSISQVLIALAAGFDGHLEARRNNGRIAKVAKRFGERFTAFLKSEVKIEGVEIGAAGSSIELSLKENTAFREELEKAVVQRIPALAKECRSFISEAIAEINAGESKPDGVVVIFDSFERLRGDKDIRESVERLLVQDRQFLDLPCHAIYTVPPWMAFVDFSQSTGFDSTMILPMCKIKDRKTRKDDPEGINAMFAILSKRADLDALFEMPRQSLLPLIHASGGYPRDLLRYMCEVLVRARIQGSKLPIPRAELKTQIDTVIRKQVEVFDLAICEEDLELLARIGKLRSIPTFKSDEVKQIARLFDHHFILSYQNGQGWCDLHPMAREGRKLQQALNPDDDTTDA